MSQRLSLTLVKTNGVLYPATNADRVHLVAFTQLIAEGQKIDVYMSEQVPETHTLGQLAKVHATIRDVARESGQDIASIKDLIKKEAGLVTIDETGQEVLRSFATCSKDELSAAIQLIVNYADLLGIVSSDPVR